MMSIMGVSSHTPSRPTGVATPAPLGERNHVEQPDQLAFDDGQAAGDGLMVGIQDTVDTVAADAFEQCRMQRLGGSRHIR